MKMGNLQESGITWRFSDSAKNLWELLTGDDVSDLARRISV